MTSKRIYGPYKRESSSLCFGTMQFGAGATEADSAQMYEDCRAAGINFFDTAYVYTCLLYTSPSPRDISTSRMPSSA